MSDESRFIDDPDPEPAPAADPKAAKKVAGPRFKQDHEADASKRTTAILVVMFLLAALGGILFALPVFFSPPPRPRLLTVHVERYDSPAWGLAAWANRDADALVAAFHEPDVGRSADADKNFLQFSKLRSRLDEIRTMLGDPANAKRPLVLSMSALAAVHPESGVPCLLPTDADPFDPARWLPLDTVLDALADVPTTDPPIRRLLLLDLAHPTADPLLGRPQDVASSAVCALLKKRQSEGTLPCAVLTSAGPGEVSLPAPRAKLSAFGLYLSDGLGGAAAGNGGKDDEVTVSGLAQFVAARVERFARQVHDRPQHPQLFTPADPKWDFVLTTRVTPTPPEVPQEPLKPEEFAYAAPLRSAWQRWDGLLKADADRVDPEAFARLTGYLLWAERLWLGTDDAGYAGGICEQAFNRWEEDRRASRPGGRTADDGADPRAKAARMRLAVRDAPQAPPDLGRLLNQYLDARTAVDAKPEGWKAEKQAWDAKAADPAALRLVWRKLGEDQEPTRNRVRALSDILDEMTAGDNPPPLERLLARFLARRSFQNEQDLVNYPSEAVTAWLQAENQLGRVLAAGTTGFARQKRALDEAEGERRAAAEGLFRARSSAEAKTATDRFVAAADGFRKAADGVGPGPKVAAAVPPLLRAVLAYQPGATVAGGDWFARWGDGTRLLESLLGGQRLDPAALNRLADEATGVTGRMAELTAPARVEELEKRPVPWGKMETLRGATALVAGPVLPADQRARVWELIRREWWLKHDAIRKLDAADVEARARPTVSPAGAVDPDPTDGRRVEAATTLLRLALGNDAPASAWRIEIPDRAGRAVRDQDWPAATRLLRVVPPTVAAAGKEPRSVPGVAALDRPSTEDRAAYRLWLRRQLEDGYKTAVGNQTLWDKIDPDRKLRREVAAD